MRGRARKKDSHFVILCATEDAKIKVNMLQKQESNMLDAAQKIIAEQKGKEM